MKSGIFLRGAVSEQTGYGDNFDCLVQALGKNLVGVGDLSGQTRYMDGDAEWELYAAPLSYGDEAYYPARRRGAKAAIYTTWETDHLLPAMQRNLRQFDLVLTPSTWCASLFSSYGIPAVAVAPYVEHTPPAHPGEQILAGGAFQCASRKRLPETAALLERVVPAHSILCQATHPPLSQAPGVEKKKLSTTELSEWFCSGKLFFSLTRAEGWGFFQHRALAHGIPLVTPCYAGLADFVTPENSYILPHTEVFADGYFGWSLGKWADVDLAVAEEVLRSALRDPGFKHKQAAAAASVAHFTKARMRRELLAALELSGQ